jgi:uncharacterized membrane protein YgdD (TMEM256/DUF423 family)
VTILHGALQAFLAVAAGAFGAHGLKNVLDAYSLQVWETAAHYQLAHALALVLLGVFEKQSGKQKAVHALFGVGIILFSGSLYALSLSGVKQLGMITPLGGLCFLLGWLLLARAGYKNR